MKVKIKRLHKHAVVPFYASEGDAGMDLTAVSKEYDDYGNTVYGTGLAFEIPEQRNDYLNVIVATLESTIEAEIIPFLAEEQKQIEQAFEAGAKGIKGANWWWNGKKYFDENY